MLLLHIWVKIMIIISRSLFVNTMKKVDHNKSETEFLAELSQTEIT